MASKPHTSFTLHNAPVGGYCIKTPGVSRCGATDDWLEHFDFLSGGSVFVCFIKWLYVIYLLFEKGTVNVWKGRHDSVVIMQSKVPTHLCGCVGRCWWCKHEHQLTGSPWFEFQCYGCEIFMLVSASSLWKWCMQSLPAFSGQAKANFFFYQTRSSRSLTRSSYLGMEIDVFF